MRKARVLGFVFIIIITICMLATMLACNMRPTEFYDVKFSNSVFIEPYSKFTYRTAAKIDIHVNGDEYIIPEGFETDLASIPRWYWMVLAPQYSAFVGPSIIHDYFYRCANLQDRKYADSVFYYALIRNGVSHYTASKFYLAVRLFGSHSYVKDKDCEPKLDDNKFPQGPGD